MRYLLGNWKMNGQIDSIKAYEKNFKVCKGYDEVYLGIALPSIYLGNANGLKKKVFIGAQNVSEYEKGAYTGEISSQMLADLDVDFCLIGHSERRMYFNESDESLNKKIKATLTKNILPVLCIGERIDDETKLAILKSQIQNALSNLEPNIPLVVAYEPVWAIGTGKIPTIEDIESTCALVKSIIKDTLGVEKPVLYGGSVKSSNSAEIVALKSVDGLLVGGASLDPQEFINILKTY